MTQEGQLPPPLVKWAQRRDILFVTICLEDCKDPTVKIEPQMIYFKGVGGTEHKMHEVTINLFDEILPDKTVQNLQGRTIELVLKKKEEGPYWLRLTKEKTKLHWLRNDFNKWKDEDDNDEEVAITGGDKSLEEMVKQMSGLDGSGNGESESEASDSDDEELPDLF